MNKCHKITYILQKGELPIVTVLLRLLRSGVVMFSAENVNY